MMRMLRILCGVILPVAALLGLLGCNGPAPGLNPIITFDFPDGTRLPEIQSNAVLVIEGDVSAPEVNGNENTITRTQWSQRLIHPQVANPTPYLGAFGAENSAETTWLAPCVSQEVVLQLTLTVETLYGGYTEKTFEVHVQPWGDAVPGEVITWNFTGMNRANEVNMPRIASGRTLYISGTATVPVTGYAWREAVQPEVGLFSSRTVLNTVWQAPTIPAGGVQQIVTLQVRATLASGGEAVSELNVVVLPEGVVP